MRYFSRDNRKGQVLIIVLWIMLTLSILALTVAHTTRLELKLDANFTDRIRAYHAAKAGIAMAIRELRKDKNAFDHGYEPWASTEAFKSVALGKETPGGFSVSYINDNGTTVYGIRDAERLININACAPGVLAALLEQSGVQDAAAVTEEIRKWKGEVPGKDFKLDSGALIPYKGAGLSSIEELGLIPGIPGEALATLAEHCRVRGTDTININTVRPRTLEIFLDGISRASESATNGNAAVTLAAKINEFRNKGGFVEKLEDLRERVKPEGDDELNLFTALQGKLTVSSNLFVIRAIGYCGKTDHPVKSVLEAVYDRTEDKLISCHES